MSAGAAQHGTEGQSVPRRVVRVEAPSRCYEVIVGSGVLYSMTDAIRTAVPKARRAALFVDGGIIAGSMLGATMLSLGRAGLEVVHHGSMMLVPDEKAKSLANVEKMLVELTRAKLDRNDVAVALGGGVMGDMLGFAAAAYRRGIAWINCPTTLLSMVDASVGGKTGVNLDVEGSLKKNMAGAFWQPSLVVADVWTLSTLKDRHFRAGLAECIKHGMLAADWGDAGLGEWTGANLQSILKRDGATLVELVARNIAVKAGVVGKDEREEAPDADGGRAVLNLGHTFGHVLETLPGLSPDGDARNAPLHHGEAVGLGLVAASACAESMNMCPAGTADATRELLSRAGLPVAVDGLPDDDRLLTLMGDDKKVSGGKLRLVLPRGDGTCTVVSEPPREAVAAGWTALRG